MAGARMPFVLGLIEESNLILSQPKALNTFLLNAYRQPNSTRRSVSRPVEFYQNQIYIGQVQEIRGV